MCRAVVLGMVTLVTVGACAEALPRHLAPPPRALNAAAISAGPSAGAGASAFAGALAVPPDLAPPTMRGQGPAGSALAGIHAGLRAETGPLAGATHGNTAAAPAPADDAFIPSMIARMGATAAPFSRQIGLAQYDAPTRLPVSAPAPADTTDVAATPGIVSPIRTAMRVRPVTPPFSGRRPEAVDPVPSVPYAPQPTLAQPAPPPSAPFYGARSVRDALSNAERPPTVVEPIFARPAAPPPTDAPPPVATAALPLPWDADVGATSATLAPGYDSDSRALDDPMFASGADAFATVIVSNTGVEVVAEEADRGRFVFAALPSDPGAWTSGRPGAVMAADDSADPVEADATPAGDMIATLLFADGAVDVGEDERQILREVARIQKIDNRVVTLVGHASGRTNAGNTLAQRRTNMRVSRRRAEAAARALAAFGVSRSQIAVASKGDTQPLYAEVMPSGEAGNRRVEVYLAY